MSHKEQIINDVERGAGRNGSAPGILYNLSKVFNCSPEAMDTFIQKILDQKQEIFGLLYENSGRRVMKNILNMIHHDDLLSKKCG